MLLNCNKYYMLFITKLYSIETLQPKIWICSSPKISTPLIYICSRKNLVAYFHPMRMTNPIRPGWLSRANRIRWKPDKLPLPQKFSSWTDVLSVRSLLCNSRFITSWGKPSSSWIFESTLLDPKVPSWMWIRQIISASDNSAISFQF